MRRYYTQGSAGSPGVSNDRRLPDAKLIQRSYHVLAQCVLILARARLVRLSVGTLIEGDDPEAVAEVWDGQVILVAGESRPVQGHHWLSGAIAIQVAHVQVA